MLPLVHDFSEESVLVFGGGSVGARRARAFAEATVFVVSPRFDGGAFDGANTVRAEPGPGDVSGWIERVGPALVVAATDDDAVNAAIASAADDAGILLNRADRSADGPRRVDVPAIVRDGPVVASISTGGLSPSLSATLRDGVADAIEGGGEVASLGARIGDELRERGVPADRRRAALRAIVEDDDLWRAVRDGRDAETAAYAVVDRILDSEPEGNDCDR